MTNALHLPARPDAPIACDMSTAEDTPDERLAEYGRLFDDAFVRRERATQPRFFFFFFFFFFDSLARREAACCPFAGYRVETVGEEVIFAITTSVDEMLDSFYALANT